MATIRTNDLYFEFLEQTDVKFELEEMKVSDGQPYKDKVVVKAVNEEEKTQWKLTIEAGRHKTKDVATWMENKIKESSRIDLPDEDGKLKEKKCIAYDTLDAFPEKLNFAVKGTLTMTMNGRSFVIKDFVIAQGNNYLDRNNWWIGGSDCVKIVGANDPKVLSCLLEYKKDNKTMSRLLSFYSVDVNRFQIGWVDFV